MKRVLLTISYDGTAYCGWQVQPNGITVQETLQNGLEKLLGHRPCVTGCSRTDSGVHARQFCCHLDCDERIPENAFLKGLNSILPDDIAVVAVREVENDFHARYRAEGKNYVYSFYWGLPDPFLSRYALRLETKPDIVLMNEFCEGLLGTHDFEGFSSSGRSVEDTVRTVSRCETVEDGRIIRFSISANGFLYNMVRIAAGTALEVGMKRLSADCAAEIFKTKKRSLAGPTLPPQGLILNEVFYKWGE